jgi:hypothetical protein
MKQISILLFALMASFTVTDCSAQLLGKWKKKLGDKLEQKADEIINRQERKAEEKIDETIDRTVNRTEERISGNRDNNNTRRRSGGGILGRVGPPRASYNFTHFVKMRTKMTGRRARKNMTTTARLDYGTSPNVISISDMQIDGGRNNEMKDMDRMIMDIDQSAMYTFMRIENRKTRMGIKFNMVDAAEEIQKEGSRYKVLSVTKTGQSKTVAGYKADAYLCKATDNECTIWISRANNLNPYPDFYNAMNSSRLGNNRGMAIFYNDEAIKSRMKAGAMLLAYEWDDERNGDKVEMQVIDFGKARSSFSTTGYTSLSGF